MKNKIVDRTLLKFLFVGCINTVFGTAIMFLAYNWLHLSYWVSSGANYFFGSILSFFLNKYFTFQSKEKSLAEVGRFAANILVCYLLAYGIAKPLVGLLLQSFSVSIRENAAMLAGMCLFVGLNYLGQRFFAFKKP